MNPNLIGSTIEVVGMHESQHGQLCGAHVVCGTAVLREGRYVCFAKTRFAWCNDGKEEDVVEVFYLDKSLRSC